MSRPGEVPGPEELDPRGCDPEKVFEFADATGGPEGLDPEQEREMREHLASCPGCRELYERELDLNAFLSALDFSRARSSGSVSRGVAMALPTRTREARILWGLLAGLLLVMAFVSSGFDGTKPVVLAMSALGACRDLVAGSVDLGRVVFAAAGPTILLVLAVGALADLLIAFVILFASRHRRAREA